MGTGAALPAAGVMKFISYDTNSKPRIEERGNATPTLITYAEWQAAYDFFNKELFGGQLPECVIILDRRKRALGYFSPNRYVNDNGEVKDGLAMNPLYFRNSLIDTLSTLVHEMCHVWEHHFGTLKSRSTYHNKEWGMQMEKAGLMPSVSGKPGGAKTGQRMSHYIIEGPFEAACKRLIKEKFCISWADTEALGESEMQSKAEGISNSRHGGDSGDQDAAEARDRVFPRPVQDVYQRGLEGLVKKEVAVKVVLAK